MPPHHDQPNQRRERPRVLHLEHEAKRESHDIDADDEGLPHLQDAAIKRLCRH